MIGFRADPVTLIVSRTCRASRTVFEKMWTETTAATAIDARPKKSSGRAGLRIRGTTRRCNAAVSAR